MSYIKIAKIEGLKLKNGKVIPFIKSASSNTRSMGGSLAWDWHNIPRELGKPGFMSWTAEAHLPMIEEWASQGMFKWRNGGFITTEGMMKKMNDAFKKPSLKFEEGMILVHHIEASEDKRTATSVDYKPRTEEEFLEYMEKYKQKSLTIHLLRE